MAYRKHSIGDKDFSFLFGSPQVEREIVESIERMGVNGTAYRRTGTKFPMFTMQSKAGVDTFADGIETVSTYKQMVGQEPVVLVWNDIDYSVDPALGTKYKVMVLDVKMDAVKLMAEMAGNVTTANTAWLTCTWNLQLVPFDG